MAGMFQGTFDDGTPFTVGKCDHGRWEGKLYVSIGGRDGHTTFIVSTNYDTVYAVKAKGSDKREWDRIALQTIQGLWE